MPESQKILCHPAAFCPVIHRNVGIILFHTLLCHCPDRTEYKRDIQHPELFRIMLVIASQKNNPAQPLFLDQVQCYIQLILIAFHMLHHHGKMLFINLFFNNPDHRTEKRIRDALNQYCNTVCFCPFQIPCTVIGDKAGFPDDRKDPFPGFRIDIGMVIDGA